MVNVDLRVCIYFLSTVSPGKMHIPRCRHFPMQDNQGHNPKTMYSSVHLGILKFSFHHSSTKFPFNRVSNQNWFLGHDHARLTRLVMRRAICNRTVPGNQAKWVKIKVDPANPQFLFAVSQSTSQKNQPHCPKESLRLFFPGPIL